MVWGLNKSPDGRCLKCNVTSDMEESSAAHNIVVMDRRTAMIRDIVIPYEAGTESWRKSLALKVLLLRHNAVSNSMDDLREVLGWGGVGDLREPVVDTVAKHEVPGLEEVLEPAEIKRIQSRPALQQILDRVEAGNFSDGSLEEFLDHGLYHEEPEDVLPIFEKLVFRPESSEEDVLALFAKVRELRALEVIRSRYEQTED